MGATDTIRKMTKRWGGVFRENSAEKEESCCELRFFWWFCKLSADCGWRERMDFQEEAGCFEFSRLQPAAKFCQVLRRLDKARQKKEKANKAGETKNEESGK